MVALVSPLWRWAITDLDGATLTFLDKLASDRTVTPKLNEPLELTGTVPADNPEVNRLHTDGFPVLTEGVRQLYGFRRESETPPYYRIRASTLILQTDDAAASDDARTRFTCYDPWQYLYYRPVFVEISSVVQLVPQGDYTYPEAMTVDEIIVQAIQNAFDFGNVYQPLAALACFIDFGQTAFYTGTIETCDNLTGGYAVQEGVTIGQLWADLVATGLCDIVLEPIHDPVNRPGILCQLNIYKQTAPDFKGAGDYVYEAIFAWDRPGRSLIGVDDLYDGTQRANTIQFFNGGGGPPVTLYTDPTSIATYGEYWALQFFPAQTLKIPVQAIAQEQLALRKDFKQTVTVNPARERSPEPFVDYYLGDRVPIYASNRMRQAIPPDGSPSVFQRVYGIPVEIDDNGTETVRELIVGPVGAPP